MSVFYEWDVEEQDENGDIVNHDFCNSFQEAMESHLRNKNLSIPSEIVLVRDTDKTRTWAYLNSDGNLPKFFQDSQGFAETSVPQQFHREVERYQKKTLIS